MDNTFITIENLRRFLENLRASSLGSGSIDAHLVDFNNPHHITSEQIGLGNVDNTSDINKPVSSVQKDYIDSRDNAIASTAKGYTDNARAFAISTASADASAKANTVQTNLSDHMANVTDAHDMGNRLDILREAMTQYVDLSISDIVGGAPEILNTLNELSSAIGNNANFAASMADLIGQKLDSSNVVTVPTANKILRMNANGQYPPSVIFQDVNNRFFTDDEREKLAGIEVNANKYIHPIGDGNLHVPATGIFNKGKVLTAGDIPGSLSWVAPIVYTHPDTHPASIIVEDADKRFVTDVEKSIWNAKQNALSLVTQTVHGIMSFPDKIKLDGIEVNANKYIHPVTPGNVHVPNGGSIGQLLEFQSPGTAKWGVNTSTLVTHSQLNTANYMPKATYDTNNNGKVDVAELAESVPWAGVTEKPGLGDGAIPGFTINDFTTAEKNKLAGIATGATNYTHPVNHPPSIITQDAANRFFTDAERIKLAGIADSANNYTHPVNHPPSIITQDANNRFATDVEKIKWNAAEDNSKSYTDTKIDQVYTRQPVGSRGQVYYMKSDNTSEVQLGQILTSGRFVETTAELNEELSKTISFGTIFNTWERFRVIGNAGEENSWTYNAATDKVVCSINSVGYIGFVSLDKYDNYAHSVILSSTGSDDDMIGVVIAYHKDPISGKVYTLSAIRVTNVEQDHTKIAGVGTRWALVYNYCDSDAKIIANGDSKMTGGIAMWNTITNGTAVSIKREGDKITAITSQMNSTALDSNSKLEINLNSDPLLAVFRGPKQYGYSCLSQPNSTFSNVSFSDVSSMIFDIPTNKVYTFKNGAWSIDATKSLIDEVGVGRLISNLTTGKLFFIKSANEILSITTKIPLANNLVTTATGTSLDATQGKLLQDTKEPNIAAGTTAQYWKGNKTWADLGTDIRATVLSGLTMTNSVITAADTVLTAPGKLQAQITAHKGSKGVAEHGLGDGTNAGFSINDYTSAEKTKLAGITAGANVYTHPANHPASIITQDANNRFVTDVEKAKWNSTDSIFVKQTTAPANTNLLWINTTNKTLNYWGGAAWIPIVGVYA